MVITSIAAEGLGNQMFYYAMGRAVANRLGTVLKLDLSNFNRSHYRPYELDRFRIAAEIASPEEVRALTGLLGTRFGPRARTLRRACQRVGPLGRLVTGSFVHEKQFEFDPAMLSLRDNVYLHGRWQSERYFSDIAAILRDELQLKSLCDEDRDLSRCMEECECAVSIHVRRGDYVTLSQQGRGYTVLPIEYYEKAAAYMRAELGHPRFFIFSDEPLWVQDNLHLEDAIIVNLKGLDRGPRDLFLMSKCRHHIIANSTFSWWGAWLSSDRHGIICAPKQWLAPEAQQARCMDDLLPPTWIKL
jgi:hypothetical protein